MWHWTLPEPFSQITSWILLSCFHHSWRTCNQHSGCKQLWGCLHRSHWTHTPRERDGFPASMYMDRAFLVAQTVKNLPAIQETWIYPSVRKIPWRREWQSTPVFLPGEASGQKSLVGYSLWNCKELDTTSNKHTHTNPHIHTCILCDLPLPGMISFLSFWLCRMWNLSSPTRDWTNVPAVAVGSLNHWTARKVPLEWFLIWRLHNNSKDHNNNSSYFECLLCVRHITRYLTLFPLNLKTS